MRPSGAWSAAGVCAAPGGQTVWLTQASVDKPWGPWADDADRRLLEPGALKASTPPWRVPHPPHKTARAVHGPGLCTWRLCALATAYRLPGEQADTGDAPRGWPRGRRPRLEQTRDSGIVWAQGSDGIVHLAEEALWCGGTLTDRPPGSGTRQQSLAKDALTTHG